MYLSRVKSKFYQLSTILISDTKNFWNRLHVSSLIATERESRRGEMRITSRQSTTFNRRNAIIAATDTGYLFPCSRLNSPPYLGRVPTNSRISGMQLANTACIIEQLLKNMHIIWFTWDILGCSVHVNSISRQNDLWS